jgi:hypothetical protein
MRALTKVSVSGAKERAAGSRPRLRPYVVVQASCASGIKVFEAAIYVPLPLPDALTRVGQQPLGSVGASAQYSVPRRYAAPGAATNFQRRRPQQAPTRSRRSEQQLSCLEGIKQPPIDHTVQVSFVAVNNKQTQTMPAG